MNLIKRFTRNTAGRDLVVGDIHGHFTRLQQALDAVGFDPARDRLFSVGDLVDRGPESALALEWIERPWFHAVAGNHEDMAIRWPNGHMDFCTYVANGGGWNATAPRDESVRVSEAFSPLPIAIEVETARGTVGIVHADCPRPSWPQFTAELEDWMLAKNRRDALIDKAQWSRSRIEDGDDTGVRGIRAVIVGHTPLNAPRVLGNVIHIDTGGWLGGSRQFTILDLDTLAPAQALIES